MGEKCTECKSNTDCLRAGELRTIRNDVGKKIGRFTMQRVPRRSLRGFSKIMTSGACIRPNKLQRQIDLARQGNSEREKA